MWKQRYIYTLASHDDSTISNDVDSTSVVSSLYSYPETVWSQIMTPEPETIVPMCVYPYSFIPISPTELYPGCPGLLNSTMVDSSFRSVDSINYVDEFSEACNYSPTTPESSPSFENRYCSEDYSYDKSFPSNTNDLTSGEVPQSVPTVTNYGAVTILLRHLIRVDISPTKAVYVTNPPSNCVASINGTGDASCVIHPNGKILHDGPEIHLTTLNRKAKITKRGIIFTSHDHCLSYLVDASGTKTTSERFRDLHQDFSLDVFYSYCMVFDGIEECYNMVNDAEYKSYWNGDEVWFIGGFRIKQDQRGDVKVSRNGGRHIIRSSPTTGQVFVKAQQTEYKIGRYPNNYFYVRKGDKQVSASLRTFHVQNGTQKAGLNSYGKVVLS